MSDPRLDDLRLKVAAQDPAALLGGTAPKYPAPESLAARTSRMRRGALVLAAGVAIWASGALSALWIVGVR